MSVGRARWSTCPGCERTVLVTGRGTFDVHTVDPAGNYGECAWSESEAYLEEDEEDCQ